MATAKLTALTLRGSAEMVTEFFGYSINSILYQRGIYEPQTFTTVKKYNLPLQVTTDHQLQTYLNGVLSQMTNWLEAGAIKSLVLVISGLDSEEVLERWVFNVETDQKTLQTNATVQLDVDKANKEIGALIRQITSSVSFLPLLEEPCSFDLLVYTPANINTPIKWEESDPQYIAVSQEVRLRSFSTNAHKVQATVAFKAAEMVG